MDALLEGNTTTGLNVNDLSKPVYGWSMHALEKAARQGEVDEVIALLRKGADGHAILFNNGMAAHLCLTHCPMMDETQLATILEDFPDAAAHADVDGNTPLHLLCAWNKVIDDDMIICALESNPGAASRPNKANWLPLHLLLRHSPTLTDSIMQVRFQLCTQFYLVLR